MLPAAISCNSGFHKCARALSISVTSALPRRPSLSPSRVASSSPPAPPPTMTTRCARLVSVAPALPLCIASAIARSCGAGRGRLERNVDWSFRFSFLFEHDLFRKPVSTFRDHALAHETGLFVVEVPARNKVLHCRRVVARAKPVRFVERVRVLDLLKIDFDSESRPVRH